MKHGTDERAVALLKGLNRRIAAETRIPVHIPEVPLACVIGRAGAMPGELPDRPYHTLLAGAQQPRHRRHYMYNWPEDIQIARRRHAQCSPASAYE